MPWISLGPIELRWYKILDSGRHKTELNFAYVSERKDGISVRENAIKVEFKSDDSLSHSALPQDEIFEKLRAIIANQLNVDAAKVKPESKFQADLGANSLDTIELIMALEEEFDIEIPDELAKGITTVGDAVKYIQEKTRKTAIEVVDLKASQSNCLSTSTIHTEEFNAPEPGKLPTFDPSIAEPPEGFISTGSQENDLKLALHNEKFQSFFNDQRIVSNEGINDDIISLPCFDEALYCAIAREMHRYSLAEIADKHVEAAKANAGWGALGGGLLTLLTANPFAPFVGAAAAKNLTDRGKRVDEFLPDPNLLFYKDGNSFLSWTKGQVSAPRLRRIIFERQRLACGKVFFRLIPAIVTADSILPIQLVKLSSSTYFYRPLAAGIDRQQQYYDAIKLQKRYFHLRGEGHTVKTEIILRIYGSDVEEYDVNLWRFTGAVLDYFYVDFKTHPNYVF